MSKGNETKSSRRIWRLLLRRGTNPTQRVLAGIRTWTSAHLVLLADAAVIAFVGVWIASEVFPPLQNWLRDSQLVLFLVAALLLQHLAVLLGQRRPELPHGTVIDVDQSQAMPDLLEFARSGHFETVDVIAYSAATISPILDVLAGSQVDVRLLVQNPDVAPPWQSDRIRTSLASLQSVTFANNDRIDIRTYDDPPTIRGIRFGEAAISVGWYTQHNDPIVIRGHSNAVVTAAIDSAEGQALLATFDRQFRDRWARASSIKPRRKLRRRDGLRPNPAVVGCAPRAKRAQRRAPGQPGDRAVHS